MRITYDFGTKAVRIDDPNQLTGFTLFDEGLLLTVVFSSLLGHWRGLAPIPEGHSFDALEKDLSRNEDPEMAGFVDFMRALLRWVPEERLKVNGAVDHPWLNQSSSG